MSRRRRRAEPALVVISWRDIPAQVTTTGVDGDVKGLLPSRFQKAIDKAATVAGKTDHLSYIGEWRRTTVPLDGRDPQAAVDALVAQLDADHGRERLAALVRRGGLAAETSAGRGGSTPNSSGAPADASGPGRTEHPVTTRDDV